MRRYIRSTAFREGFADGFTCMFKLFVTYDYPRATRRYDTVEASWREIGVILNQCLNEEGQHIGKATREKERVAAQH